MRGVTVAVDPPYDVVVGPGALDAIDALITDRRRVVVVTQRPIAARYAGALPPGVARAGVDGAVWVELMDDGEAAKSLETVNALCRAFAGGGLLRGDAVIALGGGVVGDTAGFAAAVYHRGVALVQAPTTLLAQVDAAIGGKSAVNLPEGKNLVGAFHQPIGVVADTSVLATLPERELRCGLGEVAKYALMPGGEAVAALLDDRVGRPWDDETLAALVAACAAIKAEVVAADPQERTGVRATLNYGHTLAHALETTGGHALAHGEAVAIGLVFAAHLAYALERVGLDVAERVGAVVSGLGLPTSVPTGVPATRLTADGLLTVMRRDKKASGGLTFMLPGPDGLEAVDDPAPSALNAAFRAVGVKG